ncbi:conserved hypothetical protein [Ricinus communis]|uniref:Uncharacterized protein n=1 Tax=Ricinus communis TaxID=3988 RepID=B9S1C8_RICCO|nr:conserved hypothetical protein [Ricinus communis]
MNVEGAVNVITISADEITKRIWRNLDKDPLREGEKEEEEEERSKGARGNNKIGEESAPQASNPQVDPLTKAPGQGRAARPRRSLLLRILSSFRGLRREVQEQRVVLDSL